MFGLRLRTRPKLNASQVGVEERDKLRILLVNVEGFATAKVRKYLWILHSRIATFLLAVDESTTIKNPKAKRTKALVKFGQGASFRRILTGSPVTKSPMDLYSQCGFMSKETAWTRLLLCIPRANYAITRTQRMGSHSFQQIVGYRNLDELATKLDRFSYRVTKEEALDLPDKVYTIRHVSLTDEQTQTLHVTEECSHCTCLMMVRWSLHPAVMTQLLRLQQVLCGHCDDR